jgi:hypothetical protein
MSRRRRGEGTIIPDIERGGFRAVLSLGSVNGKRKRKIIRGTTQDEAIEKLDQARAEYRKARQLGLRPDLDKQTLNEYFAYWLEEVIRPQRSPSTYLSYADQTRRHILPALGKFQLNKLRPQHIRALIGDKLNSGLSPRSVQYIHAILRSALSTALDDDAVCFNVAERAKAPSPQKREIQPLTPDQAITFLDAVSTNRLQALYTVAHRSGCGRGSNWACGGPTLISKPEPYGSSGLYNEFRSSCQMAPSERRFIWCRPNSIAGGRWTCLKLRFRH